MFEKDVVLRLCSDMKRSDIIEKSKLSPSALNDLENRILQLYQVKSRIELAIVNLNKTNLDKN
jgi:hypothetical protein